MSAEQFIKEQRGIVVDVRGYDEYAGGNVANSINIPLQEIPQRLDEIKNLNGPLVLCCASGNRSGQAHQYLSSQGVECYNGGGWRDVNYLVAQNS
jgi:rhodanese-related sulfurtransferase